MDSGGVPGPVVRGGHAGAPEALPLVADGLSHAAAADDFLAAAVNVDTHTASLPQWFGPVSASGGAGLPPAGAPQFSGLRPACF